MSRYVICHLCHAALIYSSLDGTVHFLAWIYLFRIIYSFALGFVALFVLAVLTMETFSRKVAGLIVSVSIHICLITDNGTILQQNSREVST